MPNNQDFTAITIDELINIINDETYAENISLNAIRITIAATDIDRLLEVLASNKLKIEKLELTLVSKTKEEKEEAYLKLQQYFSQDITLLYFGLNNCPALENQNYPEDIYRINNKNRKLLHTLIFDENIILSGINSLINLKVLELRLFYIDENTFNELIKLIETYENILSVDIDLDWRWNQEKTAKWQVYAKKLACVLAPKINVFFESIQSIFEKTVVKKQDIENYIFILHYISKSTILAEINEIKVKSDFYLNALLKLRAFFDSAYYQEYLLSLENSSNDIDTLIKASSLLKLDFHTRLVELNNKDVLFDYEQHELTEYYHCVLSLLRAKIFQIHGIAQEFAVINLSAGDFYQKLLGESLQDNNPEEWKKNAVLMAKYYLQAGKAADQFLCKACNTLVNHVEILNKAPEGGNLLSWNELYSRAEEKLNNPNITPQIRSIYIYAQILTLLNKEHTNDKTQELITTLAIVMHMLHLKNLPAYEEIKIVLQQKINEKLKKLIAPSKFLETKLELLELQTWNTVPYLCKNYIKAALYFEKAQHINNFELKIEFLIKAIYKLEQTKFSIELPFLSEFTSKLMYTFKSLHEKNDGLEKNLKLPFWASKLLVYPKIDWELTEQNSPNFGNKVTERFSKAFKQKLSTFYDNNQIFVKSDLFASVNLASESEINSLVPDAP